MGASEEQTERRKGKVQGGEGTEGENGTACVSLGPVFPCGKEEGQMERPTRGRKSKVERERPRR